MEERDIAVHRLEGRKEKQDVDDSEFFLSLGLWGGLSDCLHGSGCLLGAFWLTRCGLLVLHIKFSKIKTIAPDLLLGLTFLSIFAQKNNRNARLRQAAMFLFFKRAVTKKR